MKSLLSMNKIKYTLFGLLLLTTTVTAQQQSPNNAQITIKTSYNGEAITIAAAAIGFTSSVINPTSTSTPPNLLWATVATCVNETQSIRILSNGTDPTSAVGLLIVAGQSFTVYGHNDINAFRAIRVSSSSAIYCQYSR